MGARHSAKVRSIFSRSQPWAITEAHAFLVRIPVDPPKGDAIQKFSALELPMVRLRDAEDGTESDRGRSGS